MARDRHRMSYVRVSRISNEACYKDAAVRTDPKNPVWRRVRILPP
jgi:hypothetical protein